MLTALFPATCVGCGLLLRGAAPLPLCTACAPAAVPLAPEARTIAGTTALFSYEGPLAAAITRLKFAGDAALAGPLARLLADGVASSRALIDAGPWDLIVPIPLHPLRALARGFDQVVLLTTWLRRTWPVGPPPQHRPRALRRVRQTTPQTALDGPARRRNLRGAFAARAPGALADRRVLLVDDVTTTGATLEAGRAALLEAGAAAVTGLALLRALP
ncbi:MAG: phosphoribosyltransferase family protein [Nannocystaceae bacterium]